MEIFLLLGYFALVVFAVRPIAAQLRQPLIQHLVFASAAILSLLWWFRAGIYKGLDVHFLWLTAVTLTLGWRWALFSSALATFTTYFMGNLGIHELGAYGLIGCALPIFFSYSAYVFAYHNLPRHFIVYIFFCSFIVAAGSIALKMLIYALYVNKLGLYSWPILFDNYLLLIPLLLFPEGLLNGMMMTLLVIYKPEWVKTFNDKEYLNGK